MLWYVVTYVNVERRCSRPSSVVVGLSVCRSVTLVSPAKTDETIKMPFGLSSRVGPEYHVFDGGRADSRIQIRAIASHLLMGVLTTLLGVLDD